MKTRLGWVAARVLSAGLLSGCGGGSEEDFCAAFEDVEDTEDLSTADSFDRINDLTDNAPSDIEDDVAVLEDAFGEVRSAVEDTGVDLDAKESELSQEDLDKLNGAFAEADIDQETFQAAYTNVDDWVTENCEIAQ